MAWQKILKIKNSCKKQGVIGAPDIFAFCKNGETTSLRSVLLFRSLSLTGTLQCASLSSSNSLL